MERAAPRGRLDDLDGLAVQVVEQVMRCCADVDLASELAHTIPGSARAAAVVGKLLAAVPTVNLLAGSPLCVWVSGGTLDPHWRAAYPPTSESAYAHLAFLNELYPDTGPADPTASTGDDLARLVELSARAALELHTA